MSTLYEILEMKRKHSVMKSVFVSRFNDLPYANVRIEIEAYDDTFINAYDNKGADYIFEQLEKQLIKEDVRQKICRTLDLTSFEGALVTIYSARHSEMYFLENGVNQYDIQW